MHRSSNKHTHPRILSAASLACILGLSACSSSVRIRGDERPYPDRIERTPALDIQVFRRVKTLTMTNTTAHEFGQCTLWLNARYSKRIDGFAIGQTLEIPLSEFHDEFGEIFRGGGFFAADPPQRLVLAEVESPDEHGNTRMYRLVIVADEQVG